MLAKVGSLGFTLTREAQVDLLTEEAVTTSAIEGERLNRDSVRSSVAQHLGLPAAGLPPASRSVDGLVEVLLDATQRYAAPLTAARLKRWQAALFPTGYSGLRKIRIGQWRGAEHAMQVVSGAVGRERVHYEAPPGERVEREMQRFLAWWKESAKHEDGLLRSGLAHLYFVTIHPFEDGNGRLARALSEMALAHDEHQPTRYYSLSSQILDEREAPTTGGWKRRKKATAMSRAGWSGTWAVTRGRSGRRSDWSVTCWPKRPFGSDTPKSI